MNHCENVVSHTDVDWWTRQLVHASAKQDIVGAVARCRKFLQRATPSDIRWKPDQIHHNRSSATVISQTAVPPSAVYSNHIQIHGEIHVRGFDQSR